jgi:hypothetical protein
MNSAQSHISPQESLLIGFSAYDGITSDATAVYKKIMHFTFSILRTVQSDEVIKTVGLIRGYADVWFNYPEISSVRQRMADSLVLLADLLESSGDNDGSKQARWCALFACSRDIESGRVMHPTEFDFRR